MMCSAAIVNTARGPIHIRAMDWDISGLGSATRKFWFKNGSRKFLAIGVLGHVGVVSGMLPGRYSITINWAPPTDRVDPRDYGPTFLLRDVFETCDTYEQAIYHLRRTHLATSAFFVICGNKANQGCVIERTQKSSSLREMENGVIVQTNHFMTSRMRKFNNEIDDDDGTLEYSVDRQQCLQHSVLQLSRTVSLDSAALCLDEYPVCNATTHQQMVFCPATGKSLSWRWAPK